MNKSSKHHRLFYSSILLVLLAILTSCSGTVKEQSTVFLEVEEVSIKENDSIPETEEIDLASNDTHRKSEAEEVDRKEILALKAKAIEGDRIAQKTLGYYYFAGIYVDRDYEQALRWSLQAANNGDEDAMFNCGYQYYYGLGTKVDYEESFKWYSQSADMLHPKALNALGMMYYKGLGTAKNVDLALTYSLQSAGFLHSYSMGNMGAILIENGNTIDANDWFRMAAKNYLYPSESNEIFYDMISNGEVDIELTTEYVSDYVPEDLIIDMVGRFYSGTLIDYLKASSEPYAIENLETFRFNDDVELRLLPSWGYDRLYLKDIDNDNNKEIVSFGLAGTMGIAHLQVYAGNYDEYALVDSKSSIDVNYGISGIATYKSKDYLVVANIDIGNRGLHSISIYPLSEGTLDDGVEVMAKNKGVKKCLTYKKSGTSMQLMDIVENRLTDMFIDKYDDILYHQVNTNVRIEEDINNDDILDLVDYTLYYNGTINNPIHLTLGPCSDEEVIQKLTSANELMTPMGLEVIRYDDKNYVGVMGYSMGTNNYCLTIYDLEGKERELIANYLIWMEESFIVKTTTSWIK